MGGGTRLKACCGVGANFKGSTGPIENVSGTKMLLPAPLSGKGTGISAIDGDMMAMH